MIKQVSIFLENRAGRIFEITSLLGKNQLNIRALSLADTSDFGILRLIVNDPDKAVKILKDNNFTVSLTDVFAIEVEDKPGGMANIMGIFSENSINVEYMYVFLGKEKDEAIVIMRFDDNKSVQEKLKNLKVKQIEADKLYHL